MTLAQFKETYLGKCVDFDGVYGGQCVDLARQYIKEVLDNPQPKPIIGACQLWSNYETDVNLKSYYDRIINTPNGIPAFGDIMLWSNARGGGYGHVSIFLTGSVKEFVSLDQNWPTLSVVTVTPHSYKDVLGWLRPLKQDNIGAING